MQRKIVQMALLEQWVAQTTTDVPIMRLIIDRETILYVSTITQTHQMQVRDSRTEPMIAPISLATCSIITEQIT